MKRIPPHTKEWRAVAAESSDGVALPMGAIPSRFWPLHFPERQKTLWKPGDRVRVKVRSKMRFEFVFCAIERLGKGESCSKASAFLSVPVFLYKCKVSNDMRVLGKCNLA